MGEVKGKFQQYPCHGDIKIDLDKCGSISCFQKILAFSRNSNLFLDSL